MKRVRKGSKVRERELAGSRLHSGASSPSVNLQIIWEGASIDQCSPEDCDWLRELLKSNYFDSIQDLSGLDSSELAECADRVAAILNSSDVID